MFHCSCSSSKHKLETSLSVVYLLKIVQNFKNHMQLTRAITFNVLDQFLSFKKTDIHEKTKSSNLVTGSLFSKKYWLMGPFPSN